MKLDVGTGIVLVMAVIFYVRFMLVNRGKIRSDDGSEAVPQPIQPRPAVRFSNAGLVALGILLLAVGAFFNVASGLPPMLQSAWWMPVALGLVVLILIIG